MDVAKTGGATMKGRTISSHGYVRIKMPEHPDADVAGYVYEHRLMAEKMMGRRILKTELVHHLNGDKTDNRPENLEVKSSIASHKAAHRRKCFDRRLPKEVNPLIECACGCGGKLNKFDKDGRLRRYINGHSRKGKHGFDTEATIKCACGCGTILKRFDKWGRERKYVSGHNAIRKDRGG